MIMYILGYELNLTLRKIGLYAGGVGYAPISNQHKKAEEEIKGKKGCSSEVKRLVSLL